MLSRIPLKRYKKDVLWLKKEGIVMSIPTFIGSSICYRKILMPTLKRFSGNEVVEIKIPGIETILQVRTKTSDVWVFEQVFVNKEYEFEINQFPKLIIDGGANVGYASIYFANRYPGAKIIAIEPDETNFKILRENTSLYPNIKTMKSAIWSRKKTLSVKDIGLGKWAMVVQEVDSYTSDNFEAVTIYDLLKLSGCNEISILKLDIEGAEKEVFRDNYEQWLGKVKVLIIELHDWLTKGCSESFYSATSSYPFEETQQGENILLRRAGD